MAKFAVPFGVLSTVTLFGTETAHAAEKDWKNFFKRGMIDEDSPYYDKGFASNSFTDNFKEAMELWQEIGAVIMKVFNAIGDFMADPAQKSVDLLAWVYETATNLVLHTPAFLFTNSWFNENLMQFSMLSVGIFTIMTVINSIRGAIRTSDRDRNYTDFKTVMKRYFWTVLGIGMTPFLIGKAVIVLNKVTAIISSLGSTSAKATQAFSVDTMNGLDTLALFGFDFMLLGVLVPIALQNGRRWFDLLTLSFLTPLALSCGVFDNTRHIMNEWFNGIKKIALTQLIYAFHISCIGMLLFVTKEAVVGWGLLLKLIVVLGGFYRLTQPPMFFQRYLDRNNTDIFSVLGSVKNVIVKGGGVGSATQAYKEAKKLGSTEDIKSSWKGMFSKDIIKKGKR